MTRSPRRRRASLLAGLMALLLASVTGCSGSSGQGSGGGSRDISISVIAGWDEDVAASNLWKSLLEERGYTVELRELDIASTFTGVANGQVDLYMDAWLPTTHQAYWDRWKDRLEVVSTWQEGRNTVVVPDYVTDVNTLADLEGKAARFDGRIVGIEAGAGEMEAMREKVIPTYGLTDFNLVEGSSPAMLTTSSWSLKRFQYAWWVVGSHASM